MRSRGGGDGGNRDYFTNWLDLDYQTFDQAEAEAEAAEAVELPPYGWCVMLETTAKALRKIGLDRA